MPIIKRAMKKLRHDRKRSAEMAKVRTSLRIIIKAARISPTQKKVSLAFKALDKAAKIHLIHANKSARLKSRLSRLLKKK